MRTYVDSITHWLLVFLNTVFGWNGKRLISIVHTAAAFTIATLSSHFFPFLWVPIHIWALLVGVSRIYLDLHYPTESFHMMPPDSIW